MKLRRVLSLLVPLIAVAFVVACSASSTSDPAFVGTWIGNIGPITIQFTISKTTMEETIVSGGTPGDETWNITAYDETAMHIKGEVSASSGSLSEANGTPIFLTYSIVGSNMWVNFSATDYPPDSIGGTALGRL